MSALSCVGGNAVVIDYCNAITAGKIEPLISEGRAFALSIYDDGGAENYYIEAVTMSDERGDKARFVIPGDVTQALATLDNLRFEIAECGQSRDTQVQGDFIITGGAPRINKRSNGEVARHLRRVIRIYDPTDPNQIKPEWKITTERMTAAMIASLGMDFSNANNSGLVALL